MNDETTRPVSPVRTIALTVLALIAFAANSVLCRLALGEPSIDAASFTIIRLVSGAAVLFIILAFSRGTKTRGSGGGNWPSALMLFIYAITFSYAYISLDTGTGALILFGSVQITMILLSMLGGNRLHLIEWLGVLLAFTGLVYLVLPGVAAPSPGGFILMAISGIAWGVYTLRGKGSRSPLADTGQNFIRTLPFVAIVALLTVWQAELTAMGILLAILSGAVASGLGYSVWYLALNGLNATQAAVVQLSVPVIAAFGGVIFVSEAITLRLSVSSMMILGGILIVVLGRNHLLAKVT